MVSSKLVIITYIRYYHIHNVDVLVFHAALTYIIAVYSGEGAVLIISATIHVHSVFVSTDSVAVATARNWCPLVRLNVEVSFVRRWN